MRPAVLLRSVLVLAAGTTLFLIPALINGFPFVYSDTGTYLLSAFNGYVPFDRPYWYGPFVRLTSLDGVMLQGVSVAQALLCAWCVRRVCALCVPRNVDRVFFGACALLTAGSSVAWYAGQLIPDIFTGIGLLAVFTLIRGKGARWLRLVDAVLIIAACWCHTSNLVILPLAGAVLLLLGWREGKAVIRRGTIALITTVVLAFGSLALANWVVDGKAYITRNGHVFLVGRMLDTGMLKPYLDEHCAQEHFGICAFRDGLPLNSSAFLWSDTSPVARQGGWDATREEYTRIVRGSFREPKYVWWHIRGSLQSTAEQLCQWEICHSLESHWYRAEWSPPYQVLRDHRPTAFPSYLDSLQNGGRGELDMRWPDRLYRMVLVLALIIVLWSLLRGRHSIQHSEAARFAAFALAAIVIGAWACASLSVVDSRYLGRDSWLLPLAAFLLVMEHLMPRKDAATVEARG